MWSKLMKKRRCHIAVLYAVVCTALLFSCKDDKVDADVFADRRIYLRATVESAEATTRLPFPVGYQPDRERPLDAAIWASTTSQKFEDKKLNGKGNSTEVALHTTAKFTNSKEQLLSDAVYPNNANTSVYFVGMHPQSGWSTTTGGTQATHTSAIDGKTDVMFAPEISGTYGGNTTDDKWPTFEFHHLLTNSGLFDDGTFWSQISFENCYTTLLMEGVVQWTKDLVILDDCSISNLQDGCTVYSRCILQLRSDPLQHSRNASCVIEISDAIWSTRTKTGDMRHCTRDLIE